MLGAMLGSATAFLLSRHVARRAVAEWLTTSPRFGTIERAVSARGLRVVLLLRLSPIVPFNVLNYALGLTTIPLRDFLLGSAGMLPGALRYAYCGKVAGLAFAGRGPSGVNASLHGPCYLWRRSPTAVVTEPSSAAVMAAYEREITVSVHRGLRSWHCRRPRRFSRPGFSLLLLQEESDARSSTSSRTWCY